MGLGLGVPYGCGIVARVRSWDQSLVVDLAKSPMGTDTPNDLVGLRHCHD